MPWSRKIARLCRSPAKTPGSSMTNLTVTVALAGATSTSLSNLPSFAVISRDADGDVAAAVAAMAVARAPPAAFAAAVCSACAGAARRRAAGGGGGVWVGWISAARRGLASPSAAAGDGQRQQRDGKAREGGYRCEVLHGLSPFFAPPTSAAPAPAGRRRRRG